MLELLVYSMLFLALIGHCFFSNKMYRAVHQNPDLKTQEKNDWKLKALVFPAYFWMKYKQQICDK